MKAKLKTNKVIDIVLKEEKFYFPGETIQGTVIVQPKSSIRVNPIILKFTGVISISDKESIPLFQSCKTILVNEGKGKLEQKPYQFSFDFLVPDNLPSVMDFGKKKLARIEYKLIAILDRPMLPEGLCPRIEYPINILEYVDVTKDNFNRPIEKQKEVTTANYGKCQVRLSVPRSGYTRGETVPVSIIVGTGSSYVRKDGLIVELIRKVKIQTSKYRIDEEHVLKSNKFDINIIGPYNFSQSIASQIVIRNTPPTIRYKEKMVRIHYKIRAQLILDDKKTPSSSFFIEIPISVGTWPPADVPIDDDDDEDIIHYMGEMMMSDDEEEDDIWIEDNDIQDVRRASSNGSTTSSRLSDYNIPANNYINRSSSTPDLIVNPLQQQMNHRSSYYEHRTSRTFAFTPATSPTQHKRIGSEDFNQRNVPNHTLTYLSSAPTTPTTSTTHDNINYANTTTITNTANTANTSTPTSAMIYPNTHNSNTSTVIGNSFSSSSSSDDDDEDDDLFAIIEKKKKKEERELRRKQRMIYGIN